ncbi:MAG: hypothetical protein M3Y66_09150 [Actinomycetota bacterium]|nr:hypothetical protein [Actinomycetota bacterium]
MTAYDAQAWSAFAVATAGASGLLTGLILLAVFLDIERTLRQPLLTGSPAMPPYVLVETHRCSSGHLAP